MLPARRRQGKTDYVVTPSICRTRDDSRGGHAASPRPARMLNCAPLAGRGRGRFFRGSEACARHVHAAFHQDAGAAAHDGLGDLPFSVHSTAPARRRAACPRVAEADLDRACRRRRVDPLPAREGAQGKTSTCRHAVPYLGRATQPGGHEAPRPAREDAGNCALCRARAGTIFSEDQKPARGTCTRPSIRMRALRLMMALVTILRPPTAPARRRAACPRGGRSRPGRARVAGGLVDQRAGHGRRRGDGDRGGAHHGVVQLAHGQRAHQHVHVARADLLAAGSHVVARARDEGDRRVLAGRGLFQRFDQAHAQRAMGADGLEARQRGVVPLMSSCSSAPV